MKELHKKMLELLKDDGRMSLVDMSKKLKVPASTLYDNLRELKKEYHFTVVKKQLT